MIRYVTGVSKDTKEECHASMVNDNIDLSRFIYEQQVEESLLRKRNREAKKARSIESSSSKSKFDVHYKPKFKKRFSRQVPSNFSKNCNARCLILNLKRGEMLIHQEKDQLVVSVV